MKRIKNPIEIYLVRILIMFVGLFGLLNIAINLYVPAEFKSYVSTVSFFLLLAFLWFGYEKIFHFLLTQVPVINSKYKLTNGEWTIFITFEDADDQGEKVRTGGVTMSSSLLGIRIEGKALLNPNTGKKTMNNWYAENGELVLYDNHEIIYYLYKIPINEGAIGDNSENKFEKIGFVCVSREKNVNAAFEGAFHDISVKSGLGIVRQGKIQLSKND
jgi:hypothetical protein